jgi:NADPH-dependent ferric siderophore reductase
MSTITRVISNTAARLLFNPARVGRITEHDRFRTIELTGDKLVDTDWKPGDKLRILVDDLSLRTYTPMARDRSTGTTRLLAYLPGQGPGSEWCEQARTGDSCQLFGPQRSVRLDELESPPIIVGDETSFGLLLAWHLSRPGVNPVAALFEVTDPAASRRVLDAHARTSATFLERAPEDEHLPTFEQIVIEAVRAHPDAPLCLTGRAQTIAAVRRRLKQEPVGTRPAAVKAYWDRNRKGLD